ncbi:dmd-9, partial [Pristionchus pacificus]
KSLLKEGMKQLSCRKCEAHGLLAPLKGHAPKCPFNNCPCHRCVSVMQLRASALVRRFRHRAPGTKTALIKTVKSKNGNMRLRILPKNGRTSPGGTEINYEHRRSSSSLSSSTDSSTSSSSLSPSPPILTPIQFVPDSQQLMNELALNQAISLFLSQSAFSLTPAAIHQVAMMHNPLFETSSFQPPINYFLLGSLSPLLSV